jgi:hypothetical protein
MAERRFLGLVEVDSATLLLVDPCYLPESNPSALTGREGGEEAAAPELAVPAVHGLGLLLRRFGGDGTFPVFGEVEDGVLVRATIEFIEPPEED